MPAAPGNGASVKLETVIPAVEVCLCGSADLAFVWDTELGGLVAVCRTCDLTHMEATIG